MKKVVVITGANRGLGKALADLALKDNKSIVVSLSRSLHPEQITQSKDKLLFLKTDLSEAFFSKTLNKIKQFIVPDSRLFVFSNAGIIGPISKAGNFTNSNIQRSLQINIAYPVSLVNYLLAQYPDNRIDFVNITSGAGNRPIAHWSLYGSSKAYMKFFFDVLSKESRDNENLKFHSIDPGVLNTSMQDEIRNSSFPDRKYFIALKNENKLISAETAALRIFEEIKYYK